MASLVLPGSACSAGKSGRRLNTLLSSQSWEQFKHGQPQGGLLRFSSSKAKEVPCEYLQTTAIQLHINLASSAWIIIIFLSGKKTLTTLLLKDQHLASQMGKTLSRRKRSIEFFFINNDLACSLKYKYNYRYIPSFLPLFFLQM